MHHTLAQSECILALHFTRFYQLITGIKNINRIRIINPRRLDKETLNNLISEAALDYASEIYEAHGKSSLEKIEAKVSKQTIFNVAAEWGYDKLKFMELVKNHLKILCNT